MSYKKYQADKLFTGTEMMDGSRVLITGDNGLIKDIVHEREAGDDIERLEGILCPGFINSHCHLELSHMKGLIPEKTGLVDFVFKVVTQRHFAEEEVQHAISKAEDEMLENGIVAVGDISNTLHTLPQKLKLRLAYYNFVEVLGWLPDAAEAMFKSSQANYDAFAKSFAATCIVPHASYSVSENLWQRIIPCFKDKVVSIHNQETAFEDELFLEGTGDFVRMYEMMKIKNPLFLPSKKSSLQTYFSKLQDAGGVILVHNTFTGPADVDYIMQQTNVSGQPVSFCLCVNANRYIEDKLPPVETLYNRNCNIVIGTDSLASNWSLSILDEIKTVRRYFPAIPIAEILQWSTFNGAKALQMDDKLGSFGWGKQPGVLCIENDLSGVKRFI
jgi:cytosine/adenosine deaminase-related metal-dependent hydrolase